jgi:hypothetical protein
VPVLRDREIVSVARYQRLIANWVTDTAESAPLRAEIMAAAVVAAHNHVLRRWLRGESHNPVREVGEAMEQVIGFFASHVTYTDAGTGTGTTSLSVV